jgi:hypothetical protein
VAGEDPMESSRKVCDLVEGRSSIYVVYKGYRKQRKKYYPTISGFGIISTYY